MAIIELKPLPAREAVEFFRAKGFEVSFAWQDVFEAEHARVFTVAKAMRIDILEDIRGAVDKAIAQGTTLAQFQAELEPMLAAKGWWGRKAVTDPKTGVTKVVELGSPRRLRTIFDVNLRTAQATGRWRRIERTAERRPFLRYVAVLDSRTRPEHRKWHGTVLPMNHPWWRTHYPPNGWRCRCIVSQLSTRDLERFGHKPSARAPASKTRPWLNKRTGETVQVPVGIDPGWAHHVGRAGAEKPYATLIDKIDGAGMGVARAAVRDGLEGPAFDRFIKGGPGEFPVGALTKRLAQAIGTEARAVRLSRETLAKQARRHPDIAAADYRRLQRMIDEGEAVQQGARHIAFDLEDGGELWRAIVKATEDGREAFVQSYHRIRPGQRAVARQRGKVIKR